ncbi:MAG TPA: hypothetical protein VL443_25330, partial [Cyclobacteriaceae bacterium]|nr:hypothetical protein [Cyclobacteriaceae bacterium]
MLFAVPHPASLLACLSNRKPYKPNLHQALFWQSFYHEHHIYIEKYFTAQGAQPFNTFTYGPQTSSLITPTSIKVNVTNSLTIEAPAG